MQLKCAEYIVKCKEMVKKKILFGGIRPVPGKSLSALQFNSGFNIWYADIIKVLCCYYAPY